jgi:hypothetical protein
MTFDELNEIIKTGRWWKLGYWKDKGVRSSLPFNSRQIREAFEIIKNIFNENWFKKSYKKPRHPLILFFLMGGLYPLGILIRLGIDLRRIQKMKGGKSLIKALKYDKENFYSFLDELRIGSWFIEKGYKIEKLKNGPDFRIKTDLKNLFIEIKRLEESESEKLFSHFVVSHLVNELTISGFESWIELTENFGRDLQFAHGLSKEERVSFLKTQIQPAIDQFKENIKKKLYEGATSHFKYKVIPSEKTSSQVKCSYLLRKSPEIRIKNKIEESVKQFKKVNKEIFGIIFINCSHIGLDNKAISSIETYINLKNFNVGIILFEESFKNERISYKKTIISSPFFQPKNFISFIEKEFN